MESEPFRVGCGCIFSIIILCGFILFNVVGDYLLHEVKSELDETIQFTNKITGKVFERETWLVDRFTGTYSHKNFFEIEGGVSGRTPVEQYGELPDNAYGGIDLGDGYTVPLYETYPISLDLDEMSITLRGISPEVDVIISISEAGMAYRYSCTLELDTYGWQDTYYSKQTEVEINDEQLQDILRSLVNSKQVLKTDGDSLEPGEYHWCISIVSSDDTTFFYIDGDETYSLFRSLLNMPIGDADYLEMKQLQEIFVVYRENIQETGIEGRDRWHQKNNRWDRNAGAELREAVQEELDAIKEYYNEREKAYYEEGLRKLAEAYEAGGSNMSFEYQGFREALTAIFEKSDF